MAPPRIYEVLREDQLTALASPMRQRLLQSATQLGEHSIAELADAAGKRPSTIYRHVALLEEVGLLVRTGERHTGRRVEALFRTPGDILSLRKATGRAGLRELVGEYALAAMREAARLLRVWYASVGNTRRVRHRRAACAQVTGWLTREEAARFEDLFDQLVHLTHGAERRPETEHVTLTIAFHPTEPPEDV